jgi:hypothetical protein
LDGSLPDLCFWCRSEIKLKKRLPYYNKKDIPNLEFKEISDKFVHKQINITSVKKATELKP